MRLATRRQRDCLRRMGLYPRPGGSGRLTRQQAWLLIHEHIEAQRAEWESGFGPDDSWMDDYQVTGSIPGDR